MAFPRESQDGSGSLIETVAELKKHQRYLHLQGPKEVVCPVPGARAHAQVTLAHAAYLVRAGRPIFVLDSNSKGLRCNRCWCRLARCHRVGAAILSRYRGSCLKWGQKGARRQQRQLPLRRPSRNQRRTGTEPRRPWRREAAVCLSKHYGASRGAVWWQWSRSPAPELSGM